jgi:hypothetical protein
VRDRVFFRSEKIAGSQRIIKIRLSTVMGVEPGGKGHRLDRIVPFHDLILLKLYDSSLGQRQRAITYWEICMWYILWWEVVRLSICGSNRGH